MAGSSGLLAVADSPFQLSRAGSVGTLVSGLAIEDGADTVVTFYNGTAAVAANMLWQIKVASGDDRKGFIFGNAKGFDFNDGLYVTITGAGATALVGFEGS